MKKCFYGKIVFPNLALMMEKQQMSGLDLSRKAGIHYYTLRRKLTGEGELLLDEAISIRNVLDPGGNVETLFMRHFRQQGTSVILSQT